MSKAPIDWSHIERIMYDSITTGRALSPAERRTLTRALSASPEEYRARHKKIKDAEVARLRMQR